MRDLFEEAEVTGFEGVPYDYATTLNKGHGRLERRECWSISDPDCLDYLGTGNQWPGLRSVVKVVGRREAETGSRCNLAIASAASMSRQNSCWQRYGPTGASRTPCTGAWT